MKPKYNQGFTQVNKVLSEKMKQAKVEQAFYKHQALKYWEEIASQFFAQSKEFLRAIDLRNGVLVIASLSKELAYQVKLLAHRIANEINQLIGKEVVHAIYVES